MTVIDEGWMEGRVECTGTHGMQNLQLLICTVRRTYYFLEVRKLHNHLALALGTMITHQRVLISNLGSE